MLPKFFTSTALLVFLLVSPGTVHSSEDGSVVSGTVLLPPVASRKASPRRGQGFVPRAKNPLRPPNGLNPRSRMVIVLDGGPVDENDRKPRDSDYNIIGENFETDILPVVAGGRVEITNIGRQAPRLYSEILPTLIKSDPINKTGHRYTEAITESHKEIDVRDRDSVHFLAHIVAFKHSYFSTVASDGSFEVKGVPAGTWTIKIWHKGGWVTNVPEATVTVIAKRDPKPTKITLPVKLISASVAP